MDQPLAQTQDYEKPTAEFQWFVEANKNGSNPLSSTKETWTPDT